MEPMDVPKVGSPPRSVSSQAAAMRGGGPRSPNRVSATALWSRVRAGQRAPAPRRPLSSNVPERWAR
jgi:hypothetical protein